MNRELSPDSKAPVSIRVLTLVIASALFMESLVSTVIATSLAAMAADLGVDPVTLKLAFTAYFVALAIFIPISGWCADRYGAKPVFLWAIVVFTAASVFCALAWDFASLIAGRFLQGVGGAMMMPVGRLIMLRLIPKHELIQSTAWLSIPTLFAPIMGPPLGGYITTFYHWRGIFWLNVPVGVLGLLLAVRLIPDVRSDSVRPLDLAGYALIAPGLSLAIFGFTLAGSRGASLSLALGMLVAGMLLLWLYVRHARRTAHAIVDLSLLRIATFRIAMVGGLLFRISVGAIPFLLPLMLQVGFGMSAFESGSLTFASAVGAVTMKLSAAPILRLWGFRNVLLANAVLSSALLAAAALFTAATPPLLIIGVLLAGGFFRSLQFTAINALGYSDIESDRMSSATGFVNVIQQLSWSAGVAVAAMLLDVFRASAGREQLVSSDFAYSFAVIGVLAVMSMGMFLRLHPDAGSEVSGHRRGGR